MFFTSSQRSVLGLPNLDPKALVIKIALGAAIVLGSGVVGAAPAAADPEQWDTHPNPFGGLTCSCQQPAPASSPAQRVDLARGIWDGSHGVVGTVTPGTQ